MLCAQGRINLTCCASRGSTRGLGCGVISSKPSAYRGAYICNNQSRGQFPSSRGRVRGVVCRVCGCLRCGESVEFTDDAGTDPDGGSCGCQFIYILFATVHCVLLFGVSGDRRVRSARQQDHPLGGARLLRMRVLKRRASFLDVRKLRIQAGC